MAKFCSKCGNPLKEGAKFCSACGEPVKQTQTQKASVTPDQIVNQDGLTAQDLQYQQMTGTGTTTAKNKNLWIFAIPVAIIILLIAIFGVKAIVSPSYLKPVKYLEKAMNKQDTDLLKNAFSEEYQDQINQMEYMMAALINADSKYKVSFKVTDKEKISKRDLEERLMDDYYVSEDIAEDAKAGYVLDTEMKIKAEGKEMTQDLIIVVAKVDGRWVIVSGM